MKKVVLILTAVVSCLSVISANYKKLPKSATLNVAVYDNAAEFKKFGVNYIYDALKKVPGIKTDIIDNLKRKTLKKYNVVIISTITKLADKDISDADRGKKGTEWIANLSNYVDSGGGIIMGHNAIGRRGVFSKYALFPMVGFASTNAPRNLNIYYTVKQARHPVMAGIAEKFVHGYDHVDIIPGKNGKVLVVDKLGKNVIVVGEASRGRVVQIAFPMGLWWGRKTATSPLPEVECQLLINAVKWAGAKQRFDIPVSTSRKRGLLAESKRYHEKIEEKEIAKYVKLAMPKFDEAAAWLPSFWMGSGAVVDSQKKVDKIVNDYKKMGFTKLIVTAKHGAFFYPTKLSNPDAKGNFPTGDAFIKAAYKRGMKVALMLSPFVNGLKEGDKFPLDVNKREYRQLKAGKISMKDIAAKVKWARKNCPDHPEVRKNALAVVKELIKMYSPDEIYLDYIRYKDGYDTACFCKYSQQAKAIFSKKHPKIPASQVDKEFSKASLISFVQSVSDVCRKAKPAVKVSCYTISAANYKAPPWVKNYPLDIHTKYVSRHSNGPESSLKDVEIWMNNYSKWLNGSKKKVAFRPIIAIYDKKSIKRLLTEFKIIYDYQKRHNIKPKRVEFYRYWQLLEGPKKNLKLGKEMPRAISRALGGSY